MSLNPSLVVESAYYDSYSKYKNFLEKNKADDFGSFVNPVSDVSEILILATKSNSANSEVYLEFMERVLLDLSDHVFKVKQSEKSFGIEAVDAVFSLVVSDFHLVPDYPKNFTTSFGKLKAMIESRDSLPLVMHPESLRDHYFKVVRPLLLYPK